MSVEFLRNLWYFALPAKALRKKQLVHKLMLGDSNAELFFRVTNLLDKDPPVIPSFAVLSTGTDTAVYDIVGRFYRTGLRFQF